jgi:hypothetical protein
VIVCTSEEREGICPGLVLFAFSAAPGGGILLLERPAGCYCQPLSGLKLEVKFDLELYPSRPEKYQENDQQQEDHKLTLLSAP